MKNEIFCIKKILKNKKLVEIPIHKKTAIFKFTKKYENKKKTIWLKEEDDLLINLSHKMKRNKWKLTSTLLTNKSAYQCYLRYKKLNPIIKKGRWSEYEDKFLIKLVNIFGKSWKSISKIIKTRTNKQIRNRYEEYLNENLNKGIFTKEEDRQLISLYADLHDNWFKYKEHIQNRSIKRIKCRINFLINRQKSIKIKEKTININSYIYSSDDSLKETLFTQESDSNYKQEKIRKISGKNKDNKFFIIFFVNIRS